MQEPNDDLDPQINQHFDAAIAWLEEQGIPVLDLAHSQKLLAAAGTIANGLTYCELNKTARSILWDYHRALLLILQVNTVMQHHTVEELAKGVQYEFGFSEVSNDTKTVQSDELEGAKPPDSVPE